MQTRTVRTAVRIAFDQASRSHIRAVIGIPIVALTLVLTTLALATGGKPGFMEDYHIILMNTSMLGQNLIPTVTSGPSDPTPTTCGPLGGVLGKLCAGATAAVGSAVSSGLVQLSNIEDDVANKLAKEIGIQQWYSLHATDVCQGNFIPDATTPKARYNVTSCTQPLQTCIGPLRLNLAELGFTRDLQDELNKIPGPLQVLTVFYILAVACSGLSVVLYFGWLFRPNYNMSWASPVVAWLTASLLFAGNIIVVVSERAVDTINSLGPQVGLSVSTGKKFAALTWTAFASALAMAMYWSYEICKDRKARKKVVVR